MLTVPYVPLKTQETSGPLLFLDLLPTFLYHAHTADLRHSPPRFISQSFDLVLTVGLGPLSSHSIPCFCASVTVLSGSGLCSSSGGAIRLVDDYRSLSCRCSTACPGSEGRSCRDLRCSTATVVPCEVWVLRHVRGPAFYGVLAAAVYHRKRGSCFYSEQSVHEGHLLTGPRVGVQLSQQVKLFRLVDQDQRLSAVVVKLGASVSVNCASFCPLFLYSTQVCAHLPSSLKLF